MPSELPAHVPWKNLDAAALAIFALHVSRRDWLIRRYDRAVFVDDRRLEWDTTFEFRLPARDLAPRSRTGTDDDAAADLVRAMLSLNPMPLPLIIKDRALLKGFDLRDAAGQPVRTLTWEETTPLVERMLVARAQRILDRNVAPGSTARTALHPEIASLLEAFGKDEVAAGAANGDIAHLATLGARLRKLHDKRRQAYVLMADPVFAGVLDDLTGGFLVVGVVRPRPGRYQVLRLHHDENSDGTVVLRAGSARSYHAEIRLPRGVAFKNTVEIIPQDLPETEAERGPEGDSWRADLDDDLLAVHAVAAYPQATITVDLMGSICSPQTGLVERTRVIGGTTIAMFAAGGLARAAGIHPDVGAAAPILAAVPAAYALLVLQESRSRTHEAVVRRPRNALRILAVLTFAGACVLAGQFPIRDYPVLSRFGWGSRALAWLVLALVASTYSIWTVATAKRRWCGTSTP